MKNSEIAAAFIGLCIFNLSCTQPATDKTVTAKSDTNETVASSTDPAQLKKEIQDIETAWSVADNARDVNTMAAFYAEDAVSMPSEQPMLVGNPAIKKDIEAWMGKRPKGS